MPAPGLPSAPGRGLSAEELCRPRPKYFLYYPIVLAGAALLLWIFPTNLVTGISSGIATVIGCLMMWQYLFINQAIRISILCATGLVIGYGAGTLNSWLTLPVGNLPLAEVVGQTVPEMANGVAAALMGCALLMVVGELLETPVLTMANRLRITTGVKNLIYINAAIIAVAFAAGKFHQGGVKMASANKAGALSEFLVFIMGGTIVLATIAFLVEEKKTQKSVLGVVILFLWLLALTQGRRSLVFPALITVGLARFAGFRWKQISVGRIILVAGAIAFLLFGVLTYQLLRLAGGGASTSISLEASRAGQWVHEGRAWRIATHSSIQNVKARTLVVTFLSDILYRERSHLPAYGKDLLLQAEIAVPSALDKNKPKIVEEGLASRQFKVFYTDQPNSLLTAGAIDFGYWGIFVYPIVTILFFSWFLRAVFTYLPYEVYFMALAIFLEAGFAVEGQLSRYFVVMRNIVIFALFLYVVTRLPTFRWRSPERKRWGIPYEQIR